MLWWVVAPFVQTLPHPPAEAPVEVRWVRREDMTPDGIWCSWEAESLMYGDQLLWGASPPEEESWCKAPFEAARMVDVLGQDGPFVSVQLTDWGCCPDKEAVTRCVTYDVRTGQPTTIADYDPKWAKWRARRVETLLSKHDGGGWTADPSSFVVGHGHVQVCAVRGDEQARISVR